MTEKRFVKDYYTTAELAELLSIKEGTLKNWRNQGVGPKYIKIGSSVRYNLTDIQVYMNQNKKG